uniref:Uncharacterized protein n=1 Tax=Arundo donax TaxID=35708 RepID=A0A0A9BCZ8_ARUDO
MVRRTLSPRCSSIRHLGSTTLPSPPPTLEKQSLRRTPSIASYTRILEIFTGPPHPVNSRGHRAPI